MKNTKKPKENNWDLIEKNEASANAMGGTELFLRYLYSGKIPRELLEQVQIVPGRVRELYMDKVRIYTLHDLPQDRECVKLQDPAFREQFHKLVFISNWQYQQFRTVLGVPYDTNSIVIENGLESIPVNIPQKFSNVTPVHVCYHTTPHRGLELLVPVFQHIAKDDPNVHLHVHSSFDMYGRPEMNGPHEALFDVCKGHPQITYYGFTEFNELRKRLPGYHIFAYPSIWEETACRSVLEAMSAGVLCVHPNYGALPDTTGLLNFQYDGTSNVNDHANRFLQVLQMAITTIRNPSSNLIDRMHFNKLYVDARYDTAKAEHLWTTLLSELVTQFPTSESRGIQRQQFIYNT